jgi:hypothetical protein
VSSTRARPVQGGLEIEVVEADPEVVEVAVLLRPQLANGEEAHGVERLGRSSPTKRSPCSSAKRARAPSRSCRGSRRPGNSTAAEVLLIPRPDAAGEARDLLARVVVVELAVRLPAGPGQELGDGVAERGLATVADVQGTGRVRGNELDEDGFAPRRQLSGRSDLRRGRGAAPPPGSRRQPEVDEPGTGDFSGRNPRAGEVERRTSSSAIWRGARPSWRARVIATLLAKSPCSGFRGRSRTISPAASTSISARIRDSSRRSRSAGINRPSSQRTWTPSWRTVCHRRSCRPLRIPCWSHLRRQPPSCSSHCDNR